MNGGWQKGELTGATLWCRKAAAMAYMPSEPQKAAAAWHLRRLFSQTCLMVWSHE